MTLETVALGVYCVVGAAWWLYNLADWLQAAPFQVEARRVAARYAILAPVWPLVALNWLGRNTGRLFLDATRSDERDPR